MRENVCLIDQRSQPLNRCSSGFFREEEEEEEEEEKEE
jgi:hypothetical protein